jgi:putative endonuclease
MAVSMMNMRSIVGRSKMRSLRIRVGKEGEQIADEYLRTLGYAIRAKNVRVGRDEIDILAFDPVDSVLVFAEVKTRSVRSRDFPAQMNAGWRKCKKLRRSARAWTEEHNYQGGYRLDLICVESGRVTEHLKELLWE